MHRSPLRVDTVPGCHIKCWRLCNSIVLFVVHSLYCFIIHHIADPTVYKLRDIVPVFLTVIRKHLSCVASRRKDMLSFTFIHIYAIPGIHVFLLLRFMFPYSIISFSVSCHRSVGDEFSVYCKMTLIYLYF